MSVYQEFPKLAPWSEQICPLCLDKKIIITHGITMDKNNHVSYFPDRGYSFCNCKSIWFTEWENIDQRYRHPNDSIKVLQHYLRTFKIYNKGYKQNKFFCVGDDPVKEEANRLGFNTESSEPANLIWCYHQLEHYERPLSELESYYEDLEKDGILFIAMPDPYFIDFNNAYSWGHWLLREHHIMWDMDSFCDELEKIGFKILMKERNFLVNIVKDYHIICQK